MSYNKADVLALLGGGGGVDATSVAGIGQAGGGSRESQHRDAAQFWELALSLKGKERLTPHQREVAQRELARHQAAAEALAHPEAKAINRYGPPPDFRGQPV